MSTVRWSVVLAGAAACSGPGSSGTPDADIPIPSELPLRLSETGLYEDFATKSLAASARPFAPNNVLWSDAADKLRWVFLPASATIDSSDMDHWTFPIGTRWFKEFSLDGKRLETRLIWQIGNSGDRENDTLFGSYLWDETESEAYFAPEGGMNLRGTEHDAPAADDCLRCHIGEPGTALGFQALQLGEVSELPLSHPPPAGTTYAVPDAALGYLHANCGHCHNPRGGAWGNNNMVLRLDIDETDAAANGIVASTVGVPLQTWAGQGFTHRIVAGDPDQSALLHRMEQRTPSEQMPPLATEKVDTAGVALVRQWIDSL